MRPLKPENGSFRLLRQNRSLCRRFAKMARNLSICLSTFLVCTCYIVVPINSQQQFVGIPLSQKEVFIGQNILLPCKIRTEQESCRWEKDGKRVLLQPGKYEWMSNHSNDCTLLIKKASLDSDDGYWICQILSVNSNPNNFSKSDIFRAYPFKLSVIVKPKPPFLKYKGVALTGKHPVIILQKEQVNTITCVSSYGNPPATLKWYVGKRQVEALIKQHNLREKTYPKTWKAYSFLRLDIWKESQVEVECVAIHSSSLFHASAKVLVKM